MFENDVKMYGTETPVLQVLEWRTFENDVKMYGTETVRRHTNWSVAFENDVKMYGTVVLCQDLVQVKMRFSSS